jgi:predicted ester cyclase
MELMTEKKQLNKEIAQHWMDCISAGAVDAICAITSRDWIMHGIPFSIPVGPEGVRALFASFGKIEQCWTVNQLIAEDDKVVVYATNHCLQENFLGIPSHGKEQVFTATFIHRIANGEIAETWRNADDLGRVLQLGARILPVKNGYDHRNGEGYLFAKTMHLLKTIKD